MGNENFDFGSDSDLNFDDNFADDDTIQSMSSGYTQSDEVEPVSNGRAAKVKEGIAKPKLIALVCMLIALAILTVLALIYRAKNGSSTNVSYTGNVDAGTTVPSVISTDNWTQFSGDIDAEFTGYIDSFIVVTDIKNKAMVTNSNNDKAVKTVVTGSVAGLNGTYEIEIPYSKSKNITLGTSFRVRYRLAEYNGYKVVTDLAYSD